MTDKIINHYRRLYAPIILILIIIGVGMAILGIANQLKQNEQRIDESKTIIENQGKILDSIDKVVGDLKADNDRQTRLITCLLAIHGESDIISEENEAECRQTVEDGVNQPATSASQQTTEQAQPAQTTPTTPNPTPEAPEEPEPPKPPEPPQSILPFVGELLIGCINRICL